ncbi:LysM peptidoglycan-binding domain-containing protein [Streptomyces ferrugineus]|uniref:LysM peptidoglycan-binding domain-containing protein n=1 Tax=Streptomyces ferrugineus TaxID=1413221 RepID=A0A7M2SJ18_9ACTN|nr:LysM peptidoglycan-binding domain-containing protein [Streptomyces ferrugineus]QOV36337.1 LysM peptidoglycan-binding domain-containing protein [Streptomyces ferrugineus]
MPRGKHRRPRTNPLTRRVAIAGTGTAALALPLLSATGAGAAEPTAAKPGSVTYTTKKGDTLYGIADRYDARGGWKQLYKDNRKVIGDDPRLIHPGMDLKVRATKKASAPSKASAPAKQSGVAKATQSSVKSYPNNLDGWIRNALDIMQQNGIPGSYEGIHRNILRESSGNPLAINNWDSNAVAGTPSKGLLQVIDPTFASYHVPGTVYDPFDPVANIVAACNYAAARYGSIDNVNGPY